MFIEEGQASALDHDRLLDGLVSFLDGTSLSADRGLCSLASRIGDGLASIPRTVQTDTPYHFVYFNTDSKSVRSSFFPTSTTASPVSSATAIPPTSISKLVLETYDHFAGESKNDFSQIYVKADNDWWLVLKRSSGRTLALFIPQLTSSGQSTVADIHDCTETIMKAHFEHIFVS